MTNPADKVEQWDIEKLIPYARNSRTHSSEQVDQIAASIKEWGWTFPILVDEAGGIIAGHGRTMAAKKLGMKTVPVMVASGWSDAKKRAYIIADNKLALNAGWDDEMLALELGELGDLGFDLDLTGFSADEIAALMPEQIEAGLTDEDEVPEIPETPVTVLGDVWILGKHRLMCGDSTSIDAVEKLMAGQKADMVFTDPMYDDSPANFIAAIDAIDVDNILLMTTFKQSAEVLKSSTWRFKFDCVLYFKTPSSMLNKKVPYYLHKNLFYMTKNDGIEGIFSCDNAKGVFSEKGYYPSVFEAKKNTQEKHGLSKPVDSLVQILSGYRAKTLIDLYAGSGTVAIACEKTNRRALMMELDPKYVDVIVKRWQDFTGKQAIHAETGKPFAEVNNNGNTQT